MAFVAYVASPAAAEESGTPPAANGQVGFQRKTQLTPTEQLQETDKELRNIQIAAAAVHRQVNEAIGKRDVTKVQCLGDKDSQLQTAASAVKERREAIKLALSRGDTGGASHEFGLVKSIGQRANQLVAEAKQCVGGEAGESESGVTVTVDRAIAQDSADYPESTANPTGGLANRPACVSCVQ